MLSDDLALVDDQDAVRERQDLVQLERDQKHGLAVVASPDQLAMNEFDRADVEAAGRLGGDQDARLASDLTREHDLLLITAGECSCACLRAPAADVVLPEQVACASNQLPRKEPAPTRARGLVEVVEGQVFRQ